MASAPRPPSTPGGDPSGGRASPPRYRSPKVPPAATVSGGNTPRRAPGQGGVEHGMSGNESSHTMCMVEPQPPPELPPPPPMALEPAPPPVLSSTRQQMTQVYVTEVYGQRNSEKRPEVGNLAATPLRGAASESDPLFQQDVAPIREDAGPVEVTAIIDGLMQRDATAGIGAVGTKRHPKTTNDAGRASKNVAAITDPDANASFTMVQTPGSHDHLRSVLSPMKLSAVKKRAKEAGVDEAKLEEADDADDVQAAVIELIVDQRPTGRAAHESG